ncbi:uncharacterized protein LOC127758198 [Oryza glaberrima]|uniref:uncharacterized protein LOC127758198 n=1 Tax=Oryza glaberrima TaxID=4538 RepID=UPI00224C2DC9|nr:uncharacterized protein LOC127758198 [Oryza glaberrima]
MDVKGRSASAPASPCVVLGDDAADAAAVAKVDRKYGSMLNAGSPLQILYTDQLADAKGGLKANAPCEITSVTECTCPLELQGMLKEECVDQYKLLSDRLLAKIVPKVARVKKPVSSSEVDAEFGVSAYSKYGTRTVSTSLRVLKLSQMWVLFLVILLLVCPVYSLTHDGSAEIGTCRFDKTSVAALSCKQPDGKWRPPSVTCCNALLNAIDHLPASNESGVCCLCRYLQLRYPNDGHGLVSSYVLCQGKDRHIVTTWSSFPITSCYTVCRQEKTSSSGMSNPVQKDHPVRNAHGTDNEVFKIPWIFGSVAFCVILLIFLWYLWWSKAASNACQLQSLPLNRNWRLSSDGGPRAERRRSSGRRSSAQLKERRMSYS